QNSLEYTFCQCQEEISNLAPADSDMWAIASYCLETYEISDRTSSLCAAPVQIQYNTLILSSVAANIKYYNIRIDLKYVRNTLKLKIFLTLIHYLLAQLYHQQT